MRQVLELLSDKAWPQGEQAHSDPKGKTALHVAAASGSIRMLWAMALCGKFCQHLGPELRQQEADTSRIKPKQQNSRERERQRFGGQRDNKWNTAYDILGHRNDRWAEPLLRVADQLRPVPARLGLRPHGGRSSGLRPIFGRQWPA